jgi:hypothetical protein
MGAGIEAAQQGDTILDGIFKGLATAGPAAEDLFGKESVGGGVLSGAKAGLEFIHGVNEGEGVGESAAGAGAGAVFDEAFEAGPIDTAINVGNSALKLAGAPQEVTDVSQTVADVTPSSFGGALASNAGRGLYNLLTGDDEALGKQVDDMAAGKAGGPLQGYSQAGEVISGLASGGDFESTIMKVGSQGRNTPLARIGNYLGDQAYKFINSDIPEATDFAKKDLSGLWDSLTGG